MDNQELIKYNLEKRKEEEEKYGKRNSDFEDLSVIFVVLGIAALWVAVPFFGGGLVSLLLQHIGI